MSPCLSTVLAAFACTGLLSAARAATLTVPAQYQTIQAAIDAAHPGDVVLIADGIYQGPGNINLSFGGKAITVTSQHGAAQTIIDCQNGFAVQGIAFFSGETAASRLQGVTIENGHYPSGGGIGITDSSPTISGCLLLNNNGAGMYLNGGTPLIIGCTFQGNTSATNSGGGAQSTGANGSFVNCTFIGNMTSATSGIGGGLYFNGGGTVSGCTFIGNQARVGGGIYVNEVFGASVFVTNSLFTGNTASVSGGGLATLGSMTLMNCTLTQNTAPAGGGLSVDSLGSATVTNSILYGDNGGEISGGAAVTHSDIQGGTAGVGNLSADPLFAQAPGNLHLRAGSSCQRAGTAAGAPTTDKDGTVRPLPPSIGALENEPDRLADIADCAVFSSTPTQNFGAAPTLVLSGFLGTVYLKFDITTLGVLAPTSTVKLHLNTASTGANTGSVVVSAAGSGWTETGLTFKTRPLVTQPLGLLTAAGTGYDVDVTGYIKAQQALGQPQVSLGLTQFSFGPAISFDSKESPAADPPQIVVTY